MHWPKLSKGDITRTGRKGTSQWWGKICLVNVIFDSFFMFSSYVLPQNIFLSINNVLLLAGH